MDSVRYITNGAHGGPYEEFSAGHGDEVLNHEPSDYQNNDYSLISAGTPGSFEHAG